jgi:A/G-specific adenine glycosylase
MTTSDATIPALLGWMASARRDLPWRRRRDPYAVWVAEIMLQQTQVATVIPYFERWMIQFPDLSALAAAPLDTVLKAWEGLGYYARARNLHRAAQRIVAQHNGQVPSDPAALRRLPGIGRYTAGAILSLAFGQRAPILDGNVRRVLCRLYDIDQDARQPATERRLWALADNLVQAAPDGRAGDLNEALMELGALVCTPAAPACGTCPLGEVCLARARGTQLLRPVLAARQPTPHYDVAAAVIRDAAGRYLVGQRPTQGLLGGLWEFPGMTVTAGGTSQGPGETLPDCLRRELREKMGIECEIGAPIGQVRHGFTHFRMTLHAYACTLAGGTPQPRWYTDVRWVGPAELAQYALPVTHLKVAGLAANLLSLHLPANPCNLSGV